MSEAVQDKCVRFQENWVGEDDRQPLPLKGLQLFLRALVIVVIAIDRSIQRSRIGENGPHHFAAIYRSCEMLMSSWPLPRLAGRMRSGEDVSR